jgi:hypothetical protein
MLTGHYYENREATFDYGEVQTVPFGYWDLIANYREYVF